MSIWLTCYLLLKLEYDELNVVLFELKQWLFSHKIQYSVHSIMIAMLKSLVHSFPAHFSIMTTILESTPDPRR